MDDYFDEIWWGVSASHDRWDGFDRGDLDNEEYLQSFSRGLPRADEFDDGFDDIPF